MEVSIFLHYSDNEYSEDPVSCDPYLGNATLVSVYSWSSLTVFMTLPDFNGAIGLACTIRQFSSHIAVHLSLRIEDAYHFVPCISEPVQ